MNIILLSGGSGQRLWPLSNAVRSKQFIKVYKMKNGQNQSMVQRVYSQIKAVDPEARITIATNQNQVPLIRTQLNDKVAISVEPERRDTFPAIALAAAFLRDRQGADVNEAVVVCPVDPYVENTYFETIQQMARLAQAGDAKLTLMGIRPTESSQKYGYIIPQNDEPLSLVTAFKEKPDEETARGYLKQNALWNGGVFAFKLSYLLDRMDSLLGFSDYDTLYARYGELQKISFDYAVVEHEPSIQVIRYDHRWDDLGNWAAFADTIPEPVIGKAALDEACSGVTVINETELPVLCMGLKDMVVAVSGDGILVSDKERSAYIKPFVDALKPAGQPVLPQGVSATMLDRAEGYAVEKLVLAPGSVMDMKEANWVLTTLAGNGVLLEDGRERPLTPGNVVSLALESGYTLMADSEMTLLKVQRVATAGQQA